MPGKINLELEVGKEYRFDEIMEKGYSYFGEVNLKDNCVLNKFGEATIFDRGNEIYLAAQSEEDASNFTIIEYYNLNTGNKVTFLGR